MGPIVIVQFIVTSTLHYNDVTMSAMASQITSLTTVYSTVYSGTNQRKHQSSASLAFVIGIHRWPVNSPHKGPVTRKIFPFDDVIMWTERVRRGVGVWGSCLWRNLIELNFTCTVVTNYLCVHTKPMLLRAHKHFPTPFHKLVFLYNH